MLAGYGTDMYVREYEAELGTPWKNTDVWLHVSYPFLHADRIKTPTLFQCGASDFNVPLLNSEQMYQALRSLGVDTQLVIYPDQYPRPDQAELSARAHAALPRLARQVPAEAARGNNRRGELQAHCCL